eukprot:NODE_640_length_5117_cov_0.610203.p2 type:complete len:150 gc:universal NODE_640_length_5117_cov_0.610203:667-1116(+)
MLFIQIVSSASVSVCWAWAYYYLQTGKLTTSNYYQWFADCCVYGTQPSHWEDGGDGGDSATNTKVKPAKQSKIPFDIPDSTMNDDDFVVSASAREFNAKGHRVYKYMRVGCAKSVGIPFSSPSKSSKSSVPSTSNTKYDAAYSTCINKL